MQDGTAIKNIGSKYSSLAPLMDERVRRRWAATEAQAYGWGAGCAVSCVTGLSPNTIRKGLAELSGREVDAEATLGSRLRWVGGGRKRRTETDRALLESLERLIDPMTRGLTSGGVHARNAEVHSGDVRF